MYEIVPAEGYQWVQPAREADFDVVYRLDSVAPHPNWRPVTMRTIDSNDAGTAWVRADLPYLADNALVARPEVLDLLPHQLRSCGEFLRLEAANEGPLWLFNTLRTAPALDESASSIERFPSSGRIMIIDKHVFLPELVDAMAFKVPGVRTLFVTEELVSAVRVAGLSGLAFKLLWESQ